MRFRRRLLHGMRGDRAGLLAAGLVEGVLLAASGGLGLGGGLLAASVGIRLGRCCSRRVWG